MDRVGALLKGFEETEPLRRRLAEVRALESWPDVVGPHLARKTRPLRVVGDRLLVAAHGSALRQELAFQEDTILRKFHSSGGSRGVRRIVFLESDPNLSSLVETGEEPPRAAERTVVPEEEEGHPEGPAYEPFDAAGYREELRRIVQEGKGREPGTQRDETWERS